MTDSFAPKAQSSIAVEQPVQMPSILGGLANLGASIAKSTKATGTPSVSAQLQGAKSNFYNTLDRAQAGVEQGTLTTNEADRMVRGAYRGFTRNYGLEEADVNDAFSNFTGISSGVEVTGNAFDEAQIAARPEFQSSLALAEINNPEADPQQLYQIALGETRRDMANQERIARNLNDEKVSWLENEANYIERADLARQNMTTLLASVDEDNILTVEEAGIVKDYWKSTFGNMRKPAGASQQEWDDFQEEYMIDADNAVDVSLKMALTKPVTDIYRQSMDQILTRALTKGKLPGMFRMNISEDQGGSFSVYETVLSQMAKDPKYAESYNFITTATSEELLGWVTDFENQTSLDFFKTDFSGFDAQEGPVRMQSLLSDSALIRPDLDDMGRTTVSVMNMLEKVEHLELESIQPKDFSNIFGQNFYTTLETIYDVNPMVGEQLTAKALRTVNGHLATMSRALNSQIAQAGMINNNGQLQINESVMKPEVVAGVKSDFGGDWTAALNAATEARQNVDEFTFMEKPYLEDLLSLDRQRKTLLARLNTFEDVKRTQDRLMESTAEKTLPVTDVEHTSGTIPQGGIDTNVGAQGLLSLIDRKEGGGDYDTLFGHSQREGGRFAGTKVSQMTIGELKQFARGGEYGSWVKAKNPKGKYATPMGRYQFVGDTLFELTDRLGIPDTAVFDSNLQDFLFSVKANDRLSGKTSQAAKRQAMRNEWDGFNSVSDAELDAAIAAFESGEPMQFGGYSVRGGSSAPKTSPRPEPTGVSTPQVAQGGAVATSPRPQARPEGGTTREAPQGSQRASEVATEQQLQALVDNQIDPNNVFSFTSEADLKAALDSGEVSPGDAVMINGEVVVIGGKIDG